MTLGRDLPEFSWVGWWGVETLPGLSSVLEESYGVMCSGMQVDGLTLGGWWVSKARENGGSEKTGQKKNHHGSLLTQLLWLTFFGFWGGGTYLLGEIRFQLLFIGTLAR